MLLSRFLTAFVVGQSFANSTAIAPERGGFVQESSEPNAQRARRSGGSPGLEVWWDTIADRTIPRILGWVILCTGTANSFAVSSAVPYMLYTSGGLLALLGKVYR